MSVSNAQNRFTVLLANDQEQWHVLVRDLLAPQGVQTVSARNGREAWIFWNKQTDSFGGVGCPDAAIGRLAGDQIGQRTLGEIG